MVYDNFIKDGMVIGLIFQFNDSIVKLVYREYI